MHGKLRTTAMLREDMLPRTDCGEGDAAQDVGAGAHHNVLAEPGKATTIRMTDSGGEQTGGFRAKAERCTPIRRDAAAALATWLRKRQGDPDQLLFPSMRGDRQANASLLNIAAQHGNAATPARGRSIGDCPLGWT
jgi:hypothetical protein